MIEAAIKKINDEMEKENNPYVKTIGEYLINLIDTTGEVVAQKINDEKKTIMGSLGAMRKEAEKHKVNNMAVLTPDQGFEVVLKYYGIKTGIKNNEFNKKTSDAEADKEPKGMLQTSLSDFI